MQRSTRRKSVTLDGCRFLRLRFARPFRCGVHSGVPSGSIDDGIPRSGSKCVIQVIPQACTSPLPRGQRQQQHYTDAGIQPHSGSNVFFCSRKEKERWHATQQRSRARQVRMWGRPASGGGQLRALLRAEQAGGRTEPAFCADFYIQAEPWAPARAGRLVQHPTRKWGRRTPHVSADHKQGMHAVAASRRSSCHCAIPAKHLQVRRRAEPGRSGAGDFGGRRLQCNPRCGME